MTIPPLSPSSSLTPTRRPRHQHRSRGYLRGKGKELLSIGLPPRADYHAKHFTRITPVNLTMTPLYR